MSKRKELILKAIYAHTLECLEDKQYDKLGMDASSLAMDLRLDRSNVSRDLNLLHQEGRLIQLNGNTICFTPAFDEVFPRAEHTRRSFQGSAAYRFSD